MHAFQKPIRRQFTADAFGLGFAVNRGADGTIFTLPVLRE